LRQRERGLSSEETMTLRPVLREFDVPFIDGDLPPHQVY
jgi:hypothetical protein